AVDQGGQETRVRSGTGIDEEFEVPNEARIGELVQPGEEELDAEGRLDQGGGSERGIATGGEAANRDGRPAGPGGWLHGLHTYIHAHPGMAEDPIAGGGGPHMLSA